MSAVNSRPPDPEKLPATRRQQEVAVYDGGELFAAIVTHCERSDGALELMSDAEKLMKSSDRRSTPRIPHPPIPILTNAEPALLDLADFLDSLDLNQLSKSMEKMAEKAKQDQKNAEDAGQEEKPGQADKTEQAERNTGLSDKILKQLLEDLEKRGEADAETTRRLQELRGRNDLKKLADELEKLGALQRAPGSRPSTIRRTPPATPPDNWKSLPGIFTTKPSASKPPASEN